MASVLFVACILCLPTLAKAEDRLAKRLVREFVGHCLQTLPDIQRIEAAARTLGWKELDRDVATMVAPKDNAVPWQGWFVPGAAPYFIGVSRAEFRGEPMATCTIANGQLPVAEALAQLQRLLPLGRVLGDYTELGQRSRLFEITVEGRLGLLMVTDGEKLGLPGFTFGAMMRLNQ
jgi:hypothetical protein